jgi:MYXO-CTERM domain-containing protein
MRSNAMKVCAMGVMLFGGTLGVSQSASAGLTWTAGDADNGNFAYSNLIVGRYDAPSFGGIASSRTADVDGLPAVLAARTWSSTDPDFIVQAGSLAPLFSGASATFSGITASGSLEGSWSVSAVVPGATADDSLSAGADGTLFFTITGTQSITISTASGLAEYSWIISDFATGAIVDLRSVTGAPATGPFPSTASSVTVDLGPGVYTINYGVGTNGFVSASGFSGDMMNFTVPAPGAAALVGLAGLVSGRRRKA